MAKNKILTVKVATDKAIAALEARLEQLNDEFAANEEREAAFKKEHAAWKKKLIVFARKALAEALKDDKNIDAWLHGRASVYAKVDATAQVSGEVPVEPMRTWHSIPEYQHQHMVEEVKQAIRILRMTDQPTVPASTMAALSRYL